MKIRYTVKKKKVYPNGSVSFVLNNGIEISEEDMKNFIRNDVVSNAFISHTQSGKEYIKGKVGSGITVEYVPKKKKIKENNFSLPYDSLENDDFEFVKDYHFPREMYDELLYWKNDIKNHYVLLLQGARQVGKTYLLKQFGKKEFKSFVYIDLSEDNNRFLDIYKRLSSNFSYKSDDEGKRLFLLNLLKLYDDSFEDSLDTLIVIDEIQESCEIYNLMRSFRRCLKSRVAFTGSYIGLTQYSKNFRTAAGDYTSLTLNSLSYLEFLNAMELYTKYKRIKSFEKLELTEFEYNFCSKIDSAYDIYTQIGGYPDVIKEYLRTKDVESAKRVIRNLLHSFYNESRRYFEGVIDDDYFNLSLMLTAQDIIRHTGDLDIEKQTLSFVSSMNQEITRGEKISCLKWLISCNLIGVCHEYTDLVKLLTTKTNKYYFTDLGFLNYFVDLLASVNESTKRGAIGENFVFLYFNSFANTLVPHKNPVKQEFVYYFFSKQDKMEIDFILLTKSNEKIGVEAKFNRGTVKSADVALEDGKIDKVIKLIKRYGGVSEDKIIIPIFMIDHIKKYL